MTETLSLFPVLHSKLITLLKALNKEDWDKPTIAKMWTVKDIASHLLDTQIRALASRDGHNLIPDRQINAYQDLVGYLNYLNAEWVSAAKRISPTVLIELLETTGLQHVEYLKTLNPHAQAQFSVAWAGEETSKNWFHIAREYTEKWHHQQQIRDAVSKPCIMTQELFYPCIDTFMYGLPHTYRNTTAATNTVVQITVSTAIGGEWFLVFDGIKWNLTKEKQYNPAASVTLTPDVSWKLFTKGISSADAIKEVAFTGDEKLAANVLNLLAVMA